MCGIAGLIAPSRSFSKEGMTPALQQLKHRGPESQQAWTNIEENVLLGHTRLCIIDKSATAAQPMHYAGRYTIVHNGELYNYLELKKELEEKGHHFTSSSDTEVIVAAYAEYKEACLQKFDGMFAFSIWDEAEKKLFAARDRFGEKPFFYSYDGQQFLFASEMKALWGMGVSKTVNTALLYNFLTIGYTSNPADPAETFYELIRSLPAASYLLYDLPKNRLVLEKYWQPFIEVNTSLKDEEAIEGFDRLLKQSVQKRLRSDVAIGTSLSGGLDSSTLVALCSQLASEQYSHKTFTAVFEGFGKNEEQYAKTVAGHFGLQHHLVHIKDEEIVPLMNKVMKHQEIPVGSASALAQYKVYEAARQNGVTVLLDGQGADEILGGYHKYYKWHWQELYRNKQLVRSGELAKARSLGVTEPFGFQNKLAALLPEFAASMLQTRKAKAAFRHPYLHRDFAFSQKQSSYYSLPTSFDLNGILYYNTFIHGLGELLHLADRNSMAHATEVRLPFLNHELVEFLFTLPSHLKIKDGWTKWLLRKSAKPLLPKEIVWRRDKVGFEPPQKEWMQLKQVREAIAESKFTLIDQNILDASVLHKKIQPHDAHAADNLDWKIWSASYLFL